MNMLCDELVQRGVEGYPAANALLDRIKRAAKFKLSHDFSMVADELTDNFNNLARALPFCRLPAADTWIEVSQADRPRYMTAPIHNDDAQGRVRRVGWLCTATRPDLSAWKIHLLWELLESGSLNASSMATEVDMKFPLDGRDARVLYKETVENRKYDWLKKPPGSHPGWESANWEARQIVSQHTQCVHPDYDLPAPPMQYLDRINLSEWAKMIHELALSDWSGEVVFHLACIGLMNSVNVARAVEVNKMMHNKKRTKQKKPLLFSHHELHIHPRVFTQMARCTNAYGTDAAVRQHFCRGHWKVRKSGIFFWRPHLRGSRELGTVEKTYSVEGNT